MRHHQAQLSAATFLAECPGLLFCADRHGALLAESVELRALFGPAPQPETPPEQAPEHASERPPERLHTRLHPDDLPRFAQAWDALTGAATELAARVRSVDGAYRVVTFRLRRGSDESTGQIFGSLQLGDHIADSGGASGNEPGSHELLVRVISEHLPIALWAINREGVFTFHRGKALAAAGLKQGELLNQNLFQIFPEEHVTLVREALYGSVGHYKNEVYGVPWENWVLPLTDKAGQIQGVVGCTLDLTESRRVERELKERLSIIEEQQRIISSLSTPIIQVWDQVLTLPIFGNVDGDRASSMMDNLLRAVVDTRTRFAILDLTGVEVIDTATASHLVSLIRALRLLGTEGIITGIKARIAQTVVGLGVDLAGITTLSTLQSALHYCIQRLNAKS